MKKNLLLAAVLMLLCATIASAQTAAPSAADKAAMAKVVQLLEGSGHGYTKAKDGIWVVNFKGTQLPEFAIITIYSEGMLIFATTVAEKAEFKPNSELMQKLLNLNDSLDRVKIGLNAKGDAVVRIDLTLRVVDQKEFNANLEQVSAAVEEIFAVLKPFLLAPRKAVK